MNFDANFSGDPQHQAFDSGQAFDQDQDFPQEHGFPQDQVFPSDQSFVHVQDARGSPDLPYFWRSNGPDHQALAEFIIRTSPGQRDAPATVSPMDLLQPNQNQAQHFHSYMQAQLLQNQAQHPQIQEQHCQDQVEVPQNHVGLFQNQAQLPVNSDQGQPYHAHDSAPELSAWSSLDPLQQMHHNDGDSDSVDHSFNGDLDRSVARESRSDHGGEPTTPEGTSQSARIAPEYVAVDSARVTPSRTTHRCDRCQKSFPTQKKVERHNRDTHGPKAYPCPFFGCPKSEPGQGFTRAWNCTRHMDNCDFMPEASPRTTTFSSQAVLSPATAAVEVKTEQGEESDMGNSPRVAGNDRSVGKRFDKKTRKHVRKARKLLRRKLTGKDLRKLQTSLKKAFECMKQVAAVEREQVAEQVLAIVIRGGRGGHKVGEEEEDDDDGNDEEDGDDGNL